jgi:alpha-1,3-glucan synthase
VSPLPLFPVTFTLTPLSFSTPSLPHFLPFSPLTFVFFQRSLFFFLLLAVPSSFNLKALGLRSPYRMRILWATWSLLSFATLILASPYRDDLVQYNLNTNQSAQSPLDYSTSSPNFTYNPSPDNWRSIPFYTILMDKFADGDPSNNDYFGTMFEYDWRETQLRAGGDLKGLESKLDYLLGMGIKGIFVSGTPFINMLWEADGKRSFLALFPLIMYRLEGYSPLDFSVLDPHWGTLSDWRNAINAIHARGMYFMADFTVGTMGDLIDFSGYVKTNLSHVPSLNVFQFFEFYHTIQS